MLSKRGNVILEITHEHDDWMTNDSRYDFGPYKKDEISVSAVKQPDKTLEIAISGPFGKIFTFEPPLPDSDEKNLTVAISWEKKKVKLYLAGRLVETKTKEPTIH